MNGRGRAIAAVVLGLFFAGAAAADTLELKDGRVLQGRYLGGTQAVLRFEINGEVQTFNVTDAVAITFTGNSGKTSAPAVAPPADAPPPPGSASARPLRLRILRLLQLLFQMLHSRPLLRRTFRRLHLRLRSQLLWLYTLPWLYLHRVLRRKTPLLSMARSLSRPDRCFWSA